ncbi:peptidylprolyl isomerase [Wolbachia endosymbiont of Cruorifilaria tuberocauda]|uniref:peptidylprolyl isomerase n=1 Tax=Wolbachia endosymbiont of Cruorifilaria tuberocauda TaxID=1812111 RepID=UPI00158B907C|nr:peptidylprolyl isomerase [Wolbachia endosymbiont of Cruorifilaria tuberocauda]QKX01523.1 peptidylprolyl isomerase [Wolbachia endosymbiont of Cruorifilaria tuberocauda]
MHKILILLLIILPISLPAVEIEIIADVNGEPISSLDIEKRVNLINSLFGVMDGRELRIQILRQLMDEIIIVDEAQRLNIKLNSEELNNATILFLTQSLKIENDEVEQYVRKYNIDLVLLKRQLECQLLWNKIIETRVIPFINICNKEVRDVKEQMEKPNYLIIFQEFTIPIRKDENFYDTAKDLVEKLRNGDVNFILESPIKMRKMTVNLNQLKSNLRSILERLEINDITGPVNISEGYYSVIKVIDKIKLDYALLESTLEVKHIMVRDSESLLDNLKKQKVNCLNFDKLADSLNLPNSKQFEVKMRSLNPDLQALFSKTDIGRIVRFRENGTTRLMMLCGIRNNVVDIEKVKQQVYQKKVMAQGNLLLETIRKNAAISYRYG